MQLDILTSFGCSRLCLFRSLLFRWRLSLLH